MFVSVVLSYCETNGWTDKRRARSISAACYVCVHRFSVCVEHESAVFVRRQRRRNLVASDAGTPRPEIKGRAQDCFTTMLLFTLGDHVYVTLTMTSLHHFSNCRATAHGRRACTYSLTVYALDRLQFQFFSVCVWVSVAVSVVERLRVGRSLSIFTKFVCMSQMWSVRRLLFVGKPEVEIEFKEVQILVAVIIISDVKRLLRPYQILRVAQNYGHPSTSDVCERYRK